MPAALAYASGAYEGLKELLARRMEEAKFAEAQRQARVREETDAADAASTRNYRDTESDYRRFLMQPKPAEPDDPKTAAMRRLLSGEGVQDTPSSRLLMGLGGVNPDQVYPKAAAPAKPDIRELRGGLMRLTPEGQLGGWLVPPKPDEQAAGAAGAQGAQGAYGASQSERITDTVDRLLAKVDNWTAGAGSTLSVFPGTPARDFRAELDTLKANVGFQQLSEMRAASRTGGALGQVSNVELRLLTSALGALDQAQSPDALKRGLATVKGSLERWEQLKQQHGATGRGAGAGPGNTGGTVRMRAPDGRTINVPSHLADEAIRRGAKRY